MTFDSELLRSTHLVMRLRLRILANMFGAGPARVPGERAERKAVAAKGPLSPLRSIIVTLVFTLMMVAIAVFGYQHIEGAYHNGGGLPEGLTFQLTVLSLAVLLMSIAATDLVNPDWDLEWLVTLPASLSSLMVSRLLERAVTNTLGLLSLLPLLTVIAWQAGYRWGAVPLAILATFTLHLIIATLTTVVDTGLRLHVRPSGLQNIATTGTLTSVLLLFLAGAFAFGPYELPLFDWAREFPAWTGWLPPGLLVRGLISSDALAVSGYLGLALLETAVLAIVGLAYLMHALRRGVVAGGSRSSGRALRVALGHSAATERWSLPPVHRRELKLLTRDRNFMAQTLVVPLLVCMVWLFPNLGHLGELMRNPVTTTLIGFGLATIVLNASAFRAVADEGDSLWILFTVPRTLASILQQKSVFWGGIALMYLLGVVVVAVIASGEFSSGYLAVLPFAIIGVPIYAAVAGAFGILASNPFASAGRRRPGLLYTFAYFGLGGLYALTLLGGDLSQRASMAFIAGLLAATLWQNAADRLEYMLDPTTTPPARVSASHGLIAVLVLLTMQTVAFGGLTRVDAVPDGCLWFVLTAIFSMLIVLVLRLVLWRKRAAGIPAFIAAGVPRALMWGAGTGIVAAAVAMGYMAVAERLDLPLIPRVGEQTSAEFLIGAAVLAPFFLEFIFRGVMFEGLRRSYGLAPAAVAAASMFALIYAPPLVAPAFVLGLLATLAYRRAGMLLAPVLAGIIFNLAVFLR